GRQSKQPGDMGFTRSRAARGARCAKKITSKTILFLTMCGMRLITAIGVNSLPMCASSEREPGPKRFGRGTGQRMAQGLGEREKYGKSGSASAEGWGGFTGG